MESFSINKLNINAFLYILDVLIYLNLHSERIYGKLNFNLCLETTG